VLVVDDDDGVRGMLDEWLRSQGFSVWLAATGQEALRLYRHHQEVIDVVLMDVCMPGLDGPRTLVRLKTMEPQVRCCFMSGNLGKYREAELIGLGAAKVIAKPFCLDEVARVLFDVAGQRALEPTKTRSAVAP
jgi:CheY-like chemotaxis protein